MYSHLNRILNFTKVKNTSSWNSLEILTFSRISCPEVKKSKKKNKFLKLTWDSHMYSESRWRFYKSKKYKFLKLPWDSNMYSHLNRVQNFTKVKEYKFLKLTWDSQVYSHLTRRWSGVRVLDLAKTAGATSLWQIMRHVSWGFCEWAFFPRFKLFYV